MSEAVGHLVSHFIHGWLVAPLIEVSALACWSLSGTPILVEEIGADGSVLCFDSCLTGGQV